jgi:molybdenum cofactor cytidylyltransferase
LMSGNVVAIVPAAGLSGRMGEFKPLLTIGGITILERCATLFQEAGIEDVRVVTGHRSEELEPLLTRLGVRIVVNPRYRDGMFASVAAGVESLGAEVDAFFVHPVDVPLVRPATIRRLMQFYRQEQRGHVIYPRFRGVRGHPPLIKASLAREIVAWDGIDGLRGALAGYEETSLDLDVADGNILLDMDTPDDLRLLRVRAERPEIPNVDECMALLEDLLHVSEEIIRHGEAVARVANRIGTALNNAGCCMDIPLLTAAGLLHDVAKGAPDHGAAGALLLREHGFAAVAEPVATHMDITVEEDEISAGEVIYLADKLVRGVSPVSIEERFRARMEHHGDDPVILAIIRGRMEKAQAIYKRIEYRMGSSLEIAPGAMNRNP